MEELEVFPLLQGKPGICFGGIDFVFLNAGMAVRDLIENTDLEMVQKVMNINFISNVVLSKELLPFMRAKKQGCFVVTSSLCGKFGIPKLGRIFRIQTCVTWFFRIAPRGK